MLDIIKYNKKEVILKTITSFLLQGLLLLIPLFYSNIIDNITIGNYRLAYIYSIISLLVGVLYYVVSYFNQVTWYMFYNTIYIYLTNMISNSKIKKISLGEYTNILNNDIDIIGTVYGNMVTRIIQIIELLVIYIYFLYINIYIFLISVLVSIILVLIIIKSNKKTEYYNMIRKSDLDDKSISIHNRFNTIFNKNKTNINYLDNTYNYLSSNKKYNLYVMKIINIILGIINIVEYLVIIYSIYLVYIGNIEIGSILLIYSYFTRMITDFEVLATVNADLKSANVSYKRIKYIEDI